MTASLKNLKSFSDFLPNTSEKFKLVSKQEEVAAPAQSLEEGLLDEEEL